MRANWTARVPPSPFRFAEIAKEAGIDFVHVSGMTESKHYPRLTGRGAAMFDYDNDGQLDLYFATMTLLPLGRSRAAEPALQEPRQRPLSGRDAASGLGYPGSATGSSSATSITTAIRTSSCATTAPTSSISTWRRRLSRISASQAGIDRWWSTGGAILDYDNDGDLDLYVANYGTWKLPEDDHYCQGVPVQFRQDNASTEDRGLLLAED